MFPMPRPAEEREDGERGGVEKEKSVSGAETAAQVCTASSNAEYKKPAAALSISRASNPSHHSSLTLLPKIQLAPSNERHCEAAAAAAQTYLLLATECLPLRKGERREERTVGNQCGNQ